MDLSNDLITQFVKTTQDKNTAPKESTVYGTIVEFNGEKYAKIDGTNELTPVETTTELEVGERVTIMIKDHTATVTGNLSSPAVRDKTVQALGDKVTEVETLMADKVDTIVLDAQIGRIDDLVSDNVTINQKLTANEASIKTLTADNVTINEKLTANEADIKDLEAENVTITGRLDVAVADIETIEADNVTINQKLVANEADINTLTADNVTINQKLTANEADIKTLQTDKLSATEADIKYANIDFSNIGKAAMEYFYANSGLIENVTIGDASITGTLAGVTIKGSLIEGGTVVADKLVIKGTDGLYYKLNTDGVKTETEQTEYNSINGNVILANSITATKINVDDLVAFDATIGGFNISENSIYSGTKESVNNTTRGIYMDKTGQLAIGDNKNYIKFYEDTDGTYKLAISAESIVFNINNETKPLEEVVNELKDEITTILYIESSKGTVFKNDSVSTVLSVVVYRGSQRITDMATLKTAMGPDVYLQWKWQHLNDDDFGIISSSDSRLSNDGFLFTLSPEDVNTKVTFMCELIT